MKLLSHPLHSGSVNIHFGLVQGSAQPSDVMLLWLLYALFVILYGAVCNQILAHILSSPE